MAREEDAGRDIKLVWALVLGGMFGLAALIYLVWGWLNKPQEAISQVDITRVAQTTRGGGTESPEYRELLEKYNQNGVAKASKDNSSFIASIEMGNSVPVTPVAPTKPSPPKEPQPSAGGQGDANGTGEDPEKRNARRQQGLADLLGRIQGTTEVKELQGRMQVAQVLGESAAGGGANTQGEMMTTGGYQSWSRSLPGAVVTRSLAEARRETSGTPSVPVEIVPPYWRGPGVIDVGVDSDNSTTPVLARLPSGRFAGAVLKANDGAKLTGDGVVIHFTEMAYGGVNYRVDAYALQDDTLLANVASEVNHRYLSRIVLPALLNGIGSAGQLFSQANTQVLTNGFNTQVVRPRLPNGRALAGTIAGGTASQASQVLTEDAARVPATQAKVFAGQVVAIQFMRGVYAGDAIAPGQGVDSVQPAVPAAPVTVPRRTQTTRTTPTNWRTQAQEQIDEQQRLLETR